LYFQCFDIFVVVCLLGLISQFDVAVVVDEYVLLCCFVACFCMVARGHFY